MEKKDNFFGKMVVAVLGRKNIASYILERTSDEIIKESRVYRNAEKNLDVLKGSLLDKICELDDAKKDLLLEREKRENMIDEAILNKEKDIETSYEEKIVLIEKEDARLREAHNDYIAKIEALETRLGTWKGRVKGVIGRNRYLTSELKKKMIELAKVRMGKGEDASKFNCSMATGEIAMENVRLRKEANEVSEEVMDLRQQLNRLGSNFHTSLYDFLETSGELKDKKFALMYLNNMGRVVRATDNIEQYLRIPLDNILGLRFNGLTRKIRREDVKSLKGDWAEGQDEYRKIKIHYGKNVDVLVQRVNGLEDEQAGTFIYVAEHNLVFSHKDHKGVLELTQKASDELGDLFKGYCALPQSK